MSKFQPIEFYERKSSLHKYKLLPFRFSELDGERYVLTNIAGEFLIAPKAAIADFVEHKLAPSNPLYKNLRSRHFLIDDRTNVEPELLAIRSEENTSELQSLMRNSNAVFCL